MGARVLLPRANLANDELPDQLRDAGAAVPSSPAYSPLAGRHSAPSCFAPALRWLGRLDTLPPGQTYPMPFSVYRMGDAIWVTCGGEPYHLIQVELRARFPDFAVLFSPLVGVMNVAYLLPEDRYGKGLYQEEPSLLAPGCLETLIEVISERIAEVAG